MQDLNNNSEYGTQTLETIAEASNFNRWMFETIRPFCSGNILEIGCGIGNISRYFVEQKAEITLSDYNDAYFSLLDKKLALKENKVNTIQLDFGEKNLEENYPELLGKFDTVYSLNVLEHIPDDNQALKNAHKLLKPNGKLIILVPAFQSLYNQFDKQLDHHRRYTKRSLQSVFVQNNFAVEHSQYFNFIGILGWYFSGQILGKKEIPQGQMKIYDSLVPLWKIVDKLTNPWWGLSVIQVATKIG